MATKPTWAGAGDLLDQVDLLRLDAARDTARAHKARLGQFLTPAPIARLMASMLRVPQREVAILDPGAGVGSLFAAATGELIGRAEPPRRISVTAYEIDPAMQNGLNATLELCAARCATAGIEFSGKVIGEDFIEAAVLRRNGSLFAEAAATSFQCAILNPPYRKIEAGSRERALLEQLGLAASNLYAGFVAAAMEFLQPGGEMVAITPRSFCNGPYFEPFRRYLLEGMRLRRVHVFESRQHAFRDDAVLQENIIVHAVRGGPAGRAVSVTTSNDPPDQVNTIRRVPLAEVIRPGDAGAVIHIAPDGQAALTAEQVRALGASLNDLGLRVSTGRVVDFRARSFIEPDPAPNTVPLIYPGHFQAGYVAWPKKGRKPNAIVASEETRDLLVPSDLYVLVKRFSAKEERRRLTAAVFDPGRVAAREIGIENHVNYIHGRLTPALARGLAAYLNSTLADDYFRQFSGHTQVNATDLRNMRYPDRSQLEALGARIGEVFPGQDELDDLLEGHLVTAGTKPKRSATLAKRKVAEACTALTALRLPRAQQNERSALTLLAMLDLKPDALWGSASSPMRGISPIMGFIRDFYGKNYAPNTRETIRRETVHQFVQAGLLIENPDSPSRPVNSPKAVYQIESGALAVLRALGSQAWQEQLAAYLAGVQSLRTRYVKERESRRIEVSVGTGEPVRLSPGGQNALIKEIVEVFLPTFVPGGVVLYLGDAGEKWAFDRPDQLAALGMELERHGKMPDAVIHDIRRNWVLLVEAVTSHGPVNAKRHAELKRLFDKSTAGLVFVTAFLDRRALKRYLGDISWETEVWVAEEPGHLIHFNGERFLGPYTAAH
ncbi:MAG TPA: BsuBI/PstI family type II restriction endonuclease [Terriglobales bacterium]|nr:BsuBI/PstI family type II restriction endonuclease [Terriglobales bacterium]